MERAVEKIGGRPVQHHPSPVFFAESKMLPTFYVDDLMLAGPDGGHDAIWNGLKKQKIALEDPDSLERFLGRTHITKTATTTNNIT